MASIWSRPQWVNILMGLTCSWAMACCTSGWVVGRPLRAGFIATSISIVMATEGAVLVGPTAPVEGEAIVWGATTEIKGKDKLGQRQSCGDQRPGDMASCIFSNIGSGNNLLSNGTHPDVFLKFYLKYKNNQFESWIENEKLCLQNVK